MSKTCYRHVGYKPRARFKATLSETCCRLLIVTPLIISFLRSMSSTNSTKEKTGLFSIGRKGGGGLELRVYFFNVPSEGDYKTISVVGSASGKRSCMIMSELIFSFEQFLANFEKFSERSRYDAQYAGGYKF